MNHEYVADYYRPARCVNCGERREHTVHSKGAPHMIDAKQIPDKVVEAYLAAELKLKTVGECLAAALNAWEGATVVKTRYVVHVGPFDPYVLLPLTKGGE